MILSMIRAMTAALRLLAAAAVCLAPLAAAGCGDDDSSAAAGGGGDMTVVATTTQAADLTRAVAGDRAEVVGLLQPNADPHDYEVRPGDVKALADADVVIRSGGDLDDWLADAIRSSGGDARQLVLIDKVDQLAGEEEGEQFDPHWWQDPRNASKAIAAIEAELSAADPDG